MLLFIALLPDLLSYIWTFQYISCYCLSCRLFFFFYQKHCFNTSHVTVYQQAREYHWKESVVSIHLMLLFIVITVTASADKRMFQYISCYCLSQSCKNLKLSGCVSIHLMLLFIQLERQGIV